MRTKRVLRYYCDHCRKGSLRKRTMGDHEVICTMNPKRHCRMCCIAKLVTKPIADLIAIANTIPAYDQDEDGIYNPPESEVNAGVQRLRDATGGCPACMLAAFRQADVCSSWSYKEERERFWNENTRELDVFC